MNKKRFAKRFAKLIEAVEATPPKDFKMEIWRKPDCKTVGCAVGQYVTRNPRCGMKLVAYNKDSLDVRCCGAGGLWAAQLHFGISWDDAARLFSPDHYNRPTKRYVLARLRAFYDTKMKEKAHA